MLVTSTPREVEANRVEHVAGGGLRGAVPARRRQRAQARQARYAGDVAAPAREHARQHRLDAVEHPDVVQLHVVDELLGVEGLLRAQDVRARVEHGNVHAPE
jgi:hypothetical protein